MATAFPREAGPAGGKPEHGEDAGWWHMGEQICPSRIIRDHLSHCRCAQVGLSAATTICLDMKPLSNEFFTHRPQLLGHGRILCPRRWLDDFTVAQIDSVAISPRGWQLRVKSGDQGCRSTLAQRLELRPAALNRFMASSRPAVCLDNSVMIVPG